jgi:hypothetical protein
MAELYNLSRFCAGRHAVGEPNTRSLSPRMKGGVVKFGDRIISAHSRQERPLPAQVNKKSLRESRFELQSAFVHVKTKNALDSGGENL